MHWGACGRVGNAFPRPPGAKKKSGRVSVTKRRIVEVLALRRGVSWKSSICWLSYLWPTICSSALHGGPPPRPPPFNCTLFRTGIRSCTALALHVAVMGSAVLSPATPQPACCFRSIRSGLQQVRVLRKLMPGKGSYMDVLCYLLKAWKRYAVPAAIASCCHGSSCALLASRLSSHTVWCCSLFMHSLQVLAFCLTALRHAGAFEKSKSRKWPLNGVSDLV